MQAERPHPDMGLTALLTKGCSMAEAVLPTTLLYPQFSYGISAKGYGSQG